MIRLNLVAAAFALMAVLASPAVAQRGGHGQPRGGGGSRPAQRQSPPKISPNRQSVRTQNFVPRNPRGFTPGQQTRPEPPRQLPTQRATYKPRTVVNPRIQSGRTFTKTALGRQYSNGLVLWKGKTASGWQRRYFPKGHYHFPYYRQRFARGSCYISPFGFYYGVCVPYIGIDGCAIFPPSVEFVDVPVYSGNQCQGFTDDGGQNFLNDPNLDQDEPGLPNALDDLTETFQNGNVDGLVALIDPNTSIAIYVRGTYQYSMQAEDYINLTRDAVKSIQASQFDIHFVHQRAPGVFSVSGQQTYRDQNGNVQSMWLSFVLQDIGGQWTLTQAETAPGNYQSLGN